MKRAVLETNSGDETKRDVVLLAKIANAITDLALKYTNTQIGAQLHIVAAHLCSAVIMLDDKE